jgi:hypothetical protein
LALCFFATQVTSTLGILGITGITGHAGDKIKARGEKPGERYWGEIPGEEMILPISARERSRDREIGDIGTVFGV